MGTSRHLFRAISYKLCILLGALGWTASARSEAPLHQRIDQAVAVSRPGLDKQAAPPAADAEFLRRLYLDLTGTIPSAAEARGFLSQAAPNRRQQLIDRLL